MFRCRSFPGQYLLLTREQREDRGKSWNSGVRHSPVVIDRGYFGAVGLRSAAGSNAGTASPIPRRSETETEFRRW
jgi:hypothetical protein